jgi:hypothetical protein
MAMVFKAFDIKITLKKNRDKSSYDINIKNKKNIAILVILLVKVISTIILVLLQSHKLVIWVTIGFLDIFSSRFVKELGNNRWIVYDQLVYTFVRLIVYAWDYLLIDWVLISIILYIIITILMRINLDYIYLKAFVPDIIYMLVLFNTPYLYYITILNFSIALYLYVFE